MTVVARTIDLTASQGVGRLATQAIRVEDSHQPRRSVAGCSVEVITDDAAFVHLEAEWNDAVERAGLAHPFLRHEWVRTWWEAFAPPGAHLHVLVVRAEGRITAIAPFMRDTVRMYGVSARRIRFLQNDQTPRTDIIVAARPSESYRAVWRALRTDRDRWDVLQLSQVERASATRRIVCELAAADGCTTGIWRSSDSPYLSLTGTWDDDVARLSAKFRSNLRNRLSRLARCGEPALEVLSDRLAIAAACEDAWRLESSGWKRAAGTAIASEPAVRHFYAALVERGAAAGWLRLLFLTIGGRRIATAYGASFKNRLLLFKTGYDPEFASGAPFKILTYFAIREAHALGLTEVDFLGDAEPWKQEWTSTCRGHDWVFVFAGTMRGRLLHALKFGWRPWRRQVRA